MANSDGDVMIRPGPLGLAISQGSNGFLFDVKGRLVHAGWNGTTYRRGLDNRVLVRQVEDGPQGPPSTQCELPETNKAAFYAELRTQLVAFRMATLAGSAHIQGQAENQLALAWLDLTLSWDHDALRREAAEFRRVYPSPVQFLPPDQALAVALHVAEAATDPMSGDAIVGRVKLGTELQAHAAAVKRLVGDDPLRRGVFLADESALLLPLPQLAEIASMARSMFLCALDGPRGGFYSFVNISQRLWRQRSEWADRAALGLRRVYLGMEVTEIGSANAVIAALHGAGLTVGAVVRARGDRVPYAWSTIGAAVSSLGLIERDALYVAEPDRAPPGRDPGIGGAAGTASAVVADHVWANGVQIRRVSLPAAHVTDPAHDQRLPGPSRFLAH